MAFLLDTTRGRTPSSDDAKIAAVALRHGLTVVNSNPSDLASMVSVLDPRVPANNTSRP